MRIANLGALVATAILLSGCVGPGETTATFTRGKLPVPLATATRAATYALYAGSDEADPVQKVVLKAGDRYGFIVKSDDSVVAVAKGEEFPLGGRLVEAWHWKAYADREGPTTRREH